MSTSKNVFFTSISLFVPSIFTYIFWFLVAKTNGSGSVGITSTIASLVIIFTTIFGMDLFFGMKPSMARFFKEEDKIKYTQVFLSIFLFLTLSSAVASIILLYPVNLLHLIGIGDQYYWLIVFAIFLFSYQNFFTELFISTMQAKEFFKFILIGSLLRFPVFGLALVLFNHKDLTTVFSYYILSFITVILSFLYTIRDLHFKDPIRNLLSDFFSILRISISSWIPNVINVCGFWLGIIIVFSLNGSQQGGRFYIAVGIFSVILFISSGISKVTHGVIQNVKKGDQIVYLSYSIKIALVFTLPISMSIMFFSSDFLEIIGKDFTNSKVNLSILMLSVPFVIFSDLIYYFLYGLRYHKEVLLLGLIGNIPRVLLYFLITIVIGSDFAALGYFIGSLLQSVFSLKLGKIKPSELDLKRKIVVCLVPLILSSVLWISHIHYILSTFIIILGSFIVYIRLDLFDKSDLHKVLYSTMPNKFAISFYKVFSNCIGVIRNNK